MTVEHLRQLRQRLESIEDLPDFDEVDRDKIIRNFLRSRQQPSRGWPFWVRKASNLVFGNFGENRALWVTLTDLPELAKLSVIRLHFGIGWRSEQDKFKGTSLSIATSLDPRKKPRRAQLDSLAQDISQVFLLTELTKQPITNIWSRTLPIELSDDTWNVYYTEIPSEIEIHVNDQLAPFKHDLTVLAQAKVKVPSI